ncbi:MAG: HEAT repeat domain-containing protein [Actinomycetota bacterium]|jgi:HEAT repeat protein
MTEEFRFEVIAAGFSGDTNVALSALTHEDGLIRASALRALARIGTLTADILSRFISDTDIETRRTAVELAAPFPTVDVHQCLDDSDVFVAEMAAWCLGERTSASDIEIETLINRTTSHKEPVVREACAAALGSLGDERGLPAILIACSDKPAVRRRAILALAPFDGEEVEAALQHALEDKDWQVRQNAEDLLNPRS